MTALTPALDVWGRWLASAAAEVTLLVAIVWAVDRLSARWLHPSVRHGLWLLVLVRLLLPPGLVPPAPAAFGALPALPLAAGAAAIDRAGAAALLAFLVWIAGASALPLVWGIRAQHVRRRLRRPGPASTAWLDDELEALARQARLRRTPGAWIDPLARGPYVTGLLAPRVMLPPDWADWPAATLTHAIAHEIAHVRRGDLRVEACWLTAVAVYWFHPLVHLARRRAHAARESSCDAEVAALFGAAYRRSMLELVAAWHGIGPAGAAPLGHGWNPVVSRLRMLERWPAPMTRRSRLAAAAILAAAGVLIVPTWVRPGPAGLTVEQIIDPAARQASGLGSLHVRYELLRRQNLERSDP